MSAISNLNMVCIVLFRVFKVRSYLLPMGQQKKQEGQPTDILQIILLPFSPLVSPLPVHPQVHLIALFSRCFQCMSAQALIFVQTKRMQRQSSLVRVEIIYIIVLLFLLSCQLLHLLGCIANRSDNEHI